MTPAEYFDRAKARGHYTSDRALADALGISQSPLSQMRRGLIKPHDDTMRRLADLAGVDQAVALMDLCEWRVVSEETKAVYASIRQRIAVAVVAGVVSLLGVVENGARTGGHEIATAIYYRKWQKTQRRRRLAAHSARQRLKNKTGIRRTAGTLTASIIGGTRDTRTRVNPAWLSGHYRASPTPKMV